MPHATARAAALDARFVLLERVGVGGMGEVYRAFDRAEERVVALKILREESPDAPGHPLAGEFDSWARLRHPFIVRAHELRRARRGPLPEGTLYLVLEYFRGIPAHRVLVPGETAPDAIEELARRVLQALEHVHGAGVVHRDLKPGNILVGRARAGIGRVKLTDFGLAVPAGIRREPFRFSGSLAYMAPETVLGGTIDGRADLYALGMLVHLLASGRFPFDPRDPDDAIRWHLTVGGADPRRAGAAIPERLARFVLRLTAREPCSRPAGAREALALLAPPRAAARTPSPRVRGARALVRIALDRVRDGDARVLRLPRARECRQAAAREATVLAQIHGLLVQRIRPGRERGTSNLARLLLHALLEDERAAREWAGRRRDLPGLPLHLLGGLPLWDRMRRETIDLARDADARNAVAAGAASVWLRAARGRGIVLVAEPGALADPVAREAIARFRREAARAEGRIRSLVLLPPFAAERRSGRRRRDVVSGRLAPAPPQAEERRQNPESDLVDERNEIGDREVDEEEGREQEEEPREPQSPPPREPTAEPLGGPFRDLDHDPRPRIPAPPVAERPPYLKSTRSSRRS